METSSGRRRGLDIEWPVGDGTRVPFEVFYDQELYELEMERIFQGAHWCYLVLEQEIPNPGDFVCTYVGDRKVVVTRGLDGSFNAFENRCIHRGAQVVSRVRGNAERFNCPYHMWCYDHAGTLTSVPQQKGVKNKGGMPDDFDTAGRGLRKMKVQSYNGILFGTFAETIIPLEQYLGVELVGHIDRITSRPIRVLGYFRQAVSANWKLYAENLRDPYHAPLLHMFHVSFGIQTPAMSGGSYMDPEGKNNCIVVLTDGREEGDRSLLEEQYKTNNKFRPEMTLADPRIIGTKRSFDDNISLVIMGIFPSLVIAQVENAFQIRHIRPKGPESFEIYWTYFGFDDDTDDETDDKLLVANMIGPAGFISMEDGEASRLVQEGIRNHTGEFSFIEMGGRGPIGNQDNLAQEIALRGFWQYYRKVMQFNGLPPREKA